MTDSTVLTLPLPGWYPDPVGAAAYRWWDGESWTEGTHAQAELPVDPEPAYAPEPAPAAAWDVPLEPIPLFAPVAEPVEIEQSAPVRRGPAPAKTRWSSLLAAFPVVYPIALAMIVGLAYAGGAASSMSTLFVIGAIAAVGLLTPAFVFADHDRRELIARGYEPAPSMGWMLLAPPIAYLLARRRVVGPSY